MRRPTLPPQKMSYRCQYPAPTTNYRHRYHEKIRLQCAPRATNTGITAHRPSAIAPPAATATTAAEFGRLAAL